MKIGLIAIFAFLLSTTSYALETNFETSIDIFKGFASEPNKTAKQDDEEPIELTDRQLRKAIRRVRLQFMLLSILEARSFIEDGINRPVNFLGEDRILDSDNLDDEDDDIKYTVEAIFKDIRIKNLLIIGKLFPEKNETDIPTWHLTLTVDEIGTCADVEATADLTAREDDGSLLDLLPAGTASTSGEACLTVKNARVPVDVTIAKDEDEEDKLISKFTVIPPEREDELDEGSKDLDVELHELILYDYAVSKFILELMEPAVEELLYKELDIETLLSEAAEEVLEAPLSF
jgi:hypothetical protein